MTALCLPAAIPKVFRRLLVVALTCGCVLLLPSDAMAQTQTDQSPAATVNLNFPSNPVTDILPYYEKLTGKRMVRDANLTGPFLTILVNAVPKHEAIGIIEHTLLHNGYAIVPLDANTVKVINAAAHNPRSESIPLVSSPDKLPSGGEVVSFFMPLRFLAPDEALQILQAHVQLHPYGAIVPVKNAQALLVTEAANVVRNLIRVKEWIDVPPAKVVTEFIQLERADAENVVELVEDLLKKRLEKLGSGNPSAPADTNNAASAEADSVFAERGQVSGDVQIKADTRTNRVIVVTRPSNMDYIRGLVTQLDEAVTVSKPYQRFLKYIKASDLLDVLQDVLAEDKKNDSASSGSSSSSSSASRQSSSSSTSSSSSSDSSSSVESRPDQLEAPSEDQAPRSIVVGKTRVIADDRSNSMLVFGPPESRDRVREILDQLDRKQPQVVLETVIATCNLDDGREWASDIFLLAGASDEGTDARMAMGQRFRAGDNGPILEPSDLTALDEFPALMPTGFNYYATYGKKLRQFIRTMETSNKFKILSRPSVYTTNNKKAVISSGQRIAVPTSTLSTTDATAGTNAAVTSNIEYKDVVLKLEVIPLINSDKEITLKIAQVNDTIVGSQTIAGNTVPTIGTQEVNTTVTLPNAATVLLGGLVGETDSRTESGIPILRSIPLLGYLFKSDTKNKNRTELIIMISPTVIDSAEESIANTQQMLDRTTVGNQVQEFAKPTNKPTDKQKKKSEKF